MPHNGYANPITNDGPGFLSDMPISKLAECDTRAIMASVISLTPLVVETTDGVMHKTWPTLPSPTGLEGLSCLTPT